MRKRFLCIPKKGGGFFTRETKTTEHREKIEERWLAKKKTWMEIPPEQSLSRGMRKWFKRLAKEKHL